MIMWYGSVIAVDYILYSINNTTLLFPNFLSANGLESDGFALFEQKRDKIHCHRFPNGFGTFRPWFEQNHWPLPAMFPIIL